MTREEAISSSENPNNCDLISRGEVLENAFAIYTHECGLVEVVGVATIKELPSVKPQPCEDAVSRKALISHIENQIREWGEDYDAQQILGDIEDMPSVKPQEPCEGCDYKEWLKGEVKPQTGHWIRITNGGAMKQMYICSECHRQIEDDGIEALITIKYPYCHCGARMSENPTSSKPEISSYYGLKSYVRERSEE